MFIKTIVVVNVWLILNFVLLVEGVHLPPFVKACVKTDPDFIGCQKKTAIESIPHIILGVPSLKIPILSPFYVDKLSLDLTSELHVDLKNCSLFGAETADIQEVNFDPTTKHGLVTSNFPFLTLLGQYSVDGKLSSFPVKGQGDINITIVNAELAFQLDWNMVKRKGVEYGHITNHSTSIEFASGSCELSNLFSENETLGQAVNNMLKENFKEIFLEVKPNVERIVSHIINTVASRLYKNVPYNELFL